MKIAVTGHRPTKLGGYRMPNPVSEAVGSLLVQYFNTTQPEEVITGMALGFDQWVAWICSEMSIPFAAYIPCDNFDSRWPPSAQQEYQFLLTRASRIVQVSPGVRYSPNLMQIRNIRMVNDGDKLLGLWNGTPGGTANCLQYARSCGKPIDFLPLPVEIWDQAREWEQSHLRRFRAAPEPVLGRPLHLRRRPRSNIVDELIAERPNENHDVLPIPVPRLTDEFPLPAPPPENLPGTERLRVTAEQLTSLLGDDILRELVRQNRHHLVQEAPPKAAVSTEDRFAIRRKVDLDE